jgi:hypothetical protein
MRLQRTAGKGLYKTAAAKTSMTATAALLTYDFLHTRPSFRLTLCVCNLINGQIDSLPQRFAWSKKRA